MPNARRVLMIKCRRAASRVGTSHAASRSCREFRRVESLRPSGPSTSVGGYVVPLIWNDWCPARPSVPVEVTEITHHGAAANTPMLTRPGDWDVPSPESPTKFAPSAAVVNGRCQWPITMRSRLALGVGSPWRKQPPRGARHPAAGGLPDRYHGHRSRRQYRRSLFGRWREKGHLVHLTRRRTTGARCHGSRWLPRYHGGVRTEGAIALGVTGSVSLRRGFIVCAMTKRSASDWADAERE